LGHRSLQGQGGGLLMKIKIAAAVYFRQFGA
jgi:hypothetical protein